jgi:hypothetical protein
MPAMLSKLYHALLTAGVDDVTATAAAEEAAQSDQRFTAIEVQLAEIKGEVGRTLDAVKALSERMDSHIRITYWILGILAAALVGLAWRLLK